MTFLPIVERELRLAARRRRTYWTRLAAAALGVVTALGMLSPGFNNLRPATVTGAHVFGVLAAGGFGLCLLAGAFITADCLSGEKREHTLGLLLLTRLTGHDIVLGKLLATSLNAVYGLVAALPVLSLALLFGGITAGEFWRMALVLLNTLFFSLAVGMGVSALSRNAYRAVAGTLAAVLLLAAAPFLGLAFGWRGNLNVAILGMSPASAYATAFAGRFGRASSLFWLSLGWTHLAAWALLACASWWVPRCAVEVAAGGLPGGRRRWRSWLEEHWFRGQARREQRPAVNPMLWLARQEPQRLAWFWSFVALAGLAWLAGYSHFRSFWLRAEVVFATTTALHLVIKCWLALEATRRFADGRRSGELELLLVTPLAVAEIVNGRMLALRRQFYAPVALVLGADLLLLLFGMESPGWWGQAGGWALAFLVGGGMFLVDCYTICWVGLWLGLTAKTPVQAFLQTLVRVLVVPWVIFVVSLLFLGSLLGELAMMWWFAIGIGNSLCLCHWASSRLYGEFRRGASLNT